MGILFGLEDVFINSDQLFPPSRVFTKDIVGDPVEPCREPSFPAKAADMLVGAQEGLLGEIIGQGEISAGKLAQ